MSEPTIEQIVAQIRTALFGKDVRENIALGIEKVHAENQQAESYKVLDNTLHALGYQTSGFVSLARYANFVHGEYYYPVFYTNTFQVTTETPIVAQDNFYIRIMDGYKALAFFITGESSATQTGWQQNSIYIPSGTKFTIVVEKVSHDASYVANIPEHVNALQILDNSAKTWYDAKNISDRFITGKYIRYDDGEYATTGGYYHIYEFRNPKFKQIRVYGSIYGRSTAEIAFYSTEEPSAASFMKSYSVIPGSWDQEHWTWGDVPEGCKLVCACSRNCLNDDTPHEIQILVDDTQGYVIDQTVINHPGLNLFNNYSYIYHYFADNLGNTPVPQNSFMDIELAHRLGFKAYEINAHMTATPGKYVCLHGASGKIGNCLISKYGEDISNLRMDAVPYETFRDDYLYKTPDTRFQTRPIFLDEALMLCKKYNMVPVVGWAGYDLVDYVRKICGENFVLGVYDTWYLKRTNHKGAISYYGALTAAQLKEQVEQMGAPFLYCVTNDQMRSLTDAELLELAGICHDNNCLIGSAGVYQTTAENAHLADLGFDFCASGWEVESFDGGNIASMRDHSTFNLFDHNGSVSNGVLTLTQGTYLRSSIGEKQIIQDGAWDVSMSGSTMVMENTGGGSAISAGTPTFSKSILRIRYSGSLSFDMGDHINGLSITSDGLKEVLLSSFFFNATPNFTATANDTVTITSCVFDASSC